jgi:hypothetical protein
MSTGGHETPFSLRMSLKVGVCTNIWCLLRTKKPDTTAKGTTRRVRDVTDTHSARCASFLTRVAPGKWGPSWRWAAIRVYLIWDLRYLVRPTSDSELGPERKEAKSLNGAVPFICWTPRGSMSRATMNLHTSAGVTQSWGRVG